MLALSSRSRPQLCRETTEAAEFVRECEEIEKVEMDGRRKRPTIRQKAKALELVEMGESTASIAAALNVSQRSVQKWKTQKLSLQAISVTISDDSTRSRVEVNKQSEVLREQVYEWFIEQRDEGVVMTQSLISAKAIELNEALGGSSDFVASNGWFDRFKKTYQINGINQIPINGESRSSHNQSSETHRKVDDILRPSIDVSAYLRTSMDESVVSEADEDVSVENEENWEEKVDVKDELREEESILFIDPSLVKDEDWNDNREQQESVGGRSRASEDAVISSECDVRAWPISRKNTSLDDPVNPSLKTSEADCRIPQTSCQKREISNNDTSDVRSAEKRHQAIAAMENLNARNPLAGGNVEGDVDNWMCGSRVRDEAAPARPAEKTDYLTFIHENGSEVVCVDGYAADAYAADACAAEEPCVSLVCTECGECFSHEETLMSHRLTHAGENPLVCTVCNERFFDKEALDVHHLSHNGNKPYVCQKCDKRFCWKTVFKKHKLVCGVIPKHFSCSHCDKTFTRLTSLRRHQRTHRGNMPFACKECPEMFYSEEYLQMHQRVHTGENTSTCIMCATACDNEGDLDKHIQKHMEEAKPFVCLECNKRYSRQEFLIAHRQTVHNVQRKPYECALCNVGFSDEADLKRHARTHSNLRRFACSFCYKQFKREESLLKHERKHIHY